LHESIFDIDYELIWASQMTRSSDGDSAAKADYWDRRAETYASMDRTSNYAENLLANLDLRKSDTVLDIGCGIGIMAIPMALRVKNVTAIDISPAMLRILQRRTSQVDIENIEVINSDWEHADITSYDIVLASRCLSGKNILDMLRKMNEAARRAVYIAWRVDSYNDFEAKVHRLQDKPYFPHPEYVVIYNILYKMGIYANLRIFWSTTEEKYHSIGEVVKNLTRGKTPSAEAEKRLEDFVKRNFRYEDGYFFRSYSMPWALIWWLKQQE
jgi:SAM-dependent methyltransferase